MATNWPAFNPATYVHPQSLCRRNIRYGPHFNQRLNLYRNATRMPGGNPLLVHVHGGAWTGLDKTSTIEADRYYRFVLAYLLNSTNFGTTAPAFDVASVEYRAQGNKLTGANPLNTPYEPTIDNVKPGQGVISMHGYNDTPVDDVQNAIQYLKDNADFWGIDPGKVVGAGYSAGGNTILNAAFSPSRHFTTRAHARHKHDRFASSSVLGVLNWVGEIDLNPWFMSLEVTGYAFGLVEKTWANVRADIDRLLLIPKSDGTYPSDCEPSPLCKRMSPIHNIRAQRPESAGIKVRSYYPIFEDTYTVTGPIQGPVETYTTIPPYDAGGHEWRQFAILADECAAAGIAHSGRTLDMAAYSGSLQLMNESTLAETYAWLQSLVA